MPTRFEELAELAADEERKRDVAQRRALGLAQQLFDGLAQHLEAPDGGFEPRDFAGGPRLISDDGVLHNANFRLWLGKTCVDALMTLQLMREETWRVTIRFSRAEDDPEPVTIEPTQDAFNAFVLDAVRKELTAESTRYAANPDTVDRLTAPGNLTPASASPVGFLHTRDS